MPVTIHLSKTLEDWWGADELVEEYRDDPELFRKVLISLIMEDVLGFIDGATWKIVSDMGIMTTTVDG